MVNVNDYKGITDSDTIENAIKSKQSDGIVIIPRAFPTLNPNAVSGLLTERFFYPKIQLL